LNICWHDLAQNDTIGFGVEKPRHCTYRADI
jgi:hypothetical protein